MSSKKGKRNYGNKTVKITESVSIALKIQLDKFMQDDNETELKFPTFLSAQERAFIHEAVAKLGLKSKSRGKGVNRFLTVYKRSGSTIIQGDANLILDSSMRCRITELSTSYPLTNKEKEDINYCPDKERSPQLNHKALGNLSNGVPQIPNTSYNPDLLKFREKLPVYERRSDLINAITHNQVVLVAGATGCGKTTQLPQLILDYCQENKLATRIFCTQPRRISAVSVAERVAYERMEKIGQTIGYQIRLESRISPRTILTYCTNGVLLRTLMGGENALNGVSHIFVDEVHERDKFSDFLLIVLRDCLPKYKDLKLVLMSATMDTQIFSRYFNNCPVITIPGRLYPVTRFFLEDILKLTQYRSKKMIAAEKELKAKLKSGQSYWTHLENLKLDDNGAGNNEKETQAQPLDPTLENDMNEFLDECFDDGSLDSFCQILYMYMSEGVPVDCTQSNGRTGLMAAAKHGLLDTLKQILVMGANPDLKDKDGKTAYDYAKENNHEECCKSLNITEKESPTESTDKNADNFLLDVYHHSTSEDLIDNNLILALLQHIHLTMPKGAVLVFLPGYDDIITLRDLIQSCPKMGGSKYQIFALHSNMQTAEQKKAFAVLPNARKIVLATNIAETSITIDDIVYVVDSGKVKEKYYESSGGVCSLQCVWASRACGSQRAGRAGRTRPGISFLLCSRRRYDALPPNAVPEILRVPLHELCLHAKLLAPPNTPVPDFLSKSPEPPSFLAVRSAVSLLKTIGAFTPVEDLTDIGRHLLDLAVEPKLGKMLLYACVLKCLDPVLTIVCALAAREPFRLSANPDARKKAAAARKEFAAETYSDHMTLLRAFQAWQQARTEGTERQFCAENLVCAATMETIVGSRSRLLAQLRALGLVKARGPGDIKDVNTHSDKWCVVKAALVAGLYPSIARVDRESGTLRTASETKVAPHPGSVLQARAGIKNLPVDWIAFEEISRNGRLCFIRCNTLVSPLTVALVAGPLKLPNTALTQRANPPGLSSDSDSEAEGVAAPESAALTLDSWLTFIADASDAISVNFLRQKFSALVSRRLAAPSRVPSPMDEHVLAAIVHVLIADEKNAGLIQPQGIGARPKPLATVDPATWRSAIQPPNINQVENLRYFVVRVDDPHSVDASLTTGAFTFTSNTAKKLLKVKQEGYKILLYFLCPNAFKHLGCAWLMDLNGFSGVIEWLYTQHVPFYVTKHVMNNLGERSRLIQCRDGQELCIVSGRALYVTLEMAAKRARQQIRPIQKHNPHN